MLDRTGWKQEQAQHQERRLEERDLLSDERLPELIDQLSDGEVERHDDPRERIRTRGRAAR
mgnify:CR=1 FL=1